MDIICISGNSPGPVCVTVSHQAAIRQVAMDIGAHPAGGWRARRPGGAWGLRCHSVHTAALMEAADAFDDAPLALAAE